MGRSKKNQPTKRRVFGLISPPLFFLPVIRRKHFSNTQQHAIIQIMPITGAMIGALSLGAKTKVAEPIRHNIVKRPSTTPTGTSTQRGSCLSSGSISEGSSWFMWHNVKVRGCALLRSPSRLPGWASDSLRHSKSLSFLLPY